MKKLLLFVLIMVMFGFSGVWSESIYVGVDGNDDTGDGSLGTPYATLGTACDYANPGDTILMLPGTYQYIDTQWCTPLGNSNNWITIMPQTPNTVIWDGSFASLGDTENMLIVGEGQYAIIDGLILQNSSGRGMSVYQSEHITIRNCLVHDVDYRAIGGSGTNIIIENNEIYNAAMANENQAFGDGGWPGVIKSTYYWETGQLSSNWTIRNNEVYNSWGEGILIASVDGCLVVNNEVHNVFSVSIYIDYAQNVTIKDNYLWFDDPTYQRDEMYNTDGVKWAVEAMDTPDDPPPYGVDNIIIVNNIIAGCRKSFSWYQEPQPPYTFYSYRNIKIFNNTTYNLTGDALYLYEVDGNANLPSGCEMRNNILEGGLVLENEATWIFSHNNWVDGIPSSGNHPNSIIDDPLLVSATIGGVITGYRLQQSSLCINAGTTGNDIPTTDIEGRPRDDGSPDIGASEYQGILPVELISFTAKSANDGVQLQWKTESEINNAGFNLYRDGRRLNPQLIQGQGTTTISHYYDYLDPTVETGKTYHYQLYDLEQYTHIEMLQNELEITYHPSTIEEIIKHTPSSYILHNNYPNPFNPNTIITFDLPEPVRVNLRIYDIRGQLVKTLLDGEMKAGSYPMQWDGTNDAGYVVDSGVYFYTISTDNFKLNETNVMVLMK